MENTLTLEPVEGRPIAVILGGRQNRKKVSLTTVEQGEKPYTQHTLSPSSVFQHVPNTNTEREVLFITGPSGSGKSTYARNYLKQYKKQYRKNPIYLFSALKSDELLDDNLGVKRINVGENLLQNPIQPEDFVEGDVEGACVVFDDIDVISDKKIRNEVYNILNQLLEIGRHHRITVILTNHLPTAGKDTRRVLNEAHCIVYFPFSGAKRQLEYLLTEYVGLDKKEIQGIRQTGTRWACLFKNYPQMCMTEHTLRLLSASE